MSDTTEPDTHPIPGWYPDPEFPDRYRWWYGNVWAPPLKEDGTDIPLYSPSGERVHVNRHLYPAPSPDKRIDYVEPPLPEGFYPASNPFRWGKWLPFLAVVLFLLAGILTYLLLNSLRAGQVADLIQNSETGLKDGNYTMVSEDKILNYDVCAYKGVAINLTTQEHIHGITVVGTGTTDCSTVASNEIKVDFVVKDGVATVISAS